MPEIQLQEVQQPLLQAASLYLANQYRNNSLVVLQDRDNVVQFVREFEKTYQGLPVQENLYNLADVLRDAQYLTDQDPSVTDIIRENIRKTFPSINNDEILGLLDNVLIGRMYPAVRIGSQEGRVEFTGGNSSVAIEASAMAEEIKNSNGSSEEYSMQTLSLEKLIGLILTGKVKMHWQTRQSQDKQ